MKNETEWARDLDYLVTVLKAEQREDPKAFYRPSANPIHHVNGNQRARFLSEKMRAVLPHIEQLVRS